MTTEPDFDRAFNGFRRMLRANAALLQVKADTPDYFCLETKSPLRKGERLAVAALKKNKNYVSFHLTPVYLYPDLLRTISPELKKRMQGKGCFNFTTLPDRDLVEEMAELVRAGTDAVTKRALLR